MHERGEERMCLCTATQLQTIPFQRALYPSWQPVKLTWCRLGTDEFIFASELHIHEVISSRTSRSAPPLGATLTIVYSIGKFKRIRLLEGRERCAW